MSYRQSIRQLKPARTQKVNLQEKVQLFLTEADTVFATLMEKSIVVAYNMKQNMSEGDAVEKGNIKAAAWKKDKKELGKDGIQQGIDIAKKISVGKFMVHTGSDSSTNNYYSKTLGYSADNTTPKTDIMGESAEYTFSMKQGGGSFLASPAAAEASGMVKSAILNYESNEGTKVAASLNKFLKFLEEDFNTLRYNDVIIEAGKGKKDFVEWYLSDSGRRATISKKEKNTKKQDDHMKAELSVYKIPSNMANWRKKIIKGVTRISKKELDSKYFPLYVSSNYQIGTGKEVTKELSKKKGLGYTVYGQINPDYFTGNDNEVIKDNSALKKQIVNILQTTIAQNEADKKFSDVFSEDEGFKKYLVYEAASGAYKFTGKLTKGNYSGSEIAVAKQMLYFKGSNVTIYPDLFDWAGNNTSLLGSVSMDFKGSARGRYTALKMDYNPNDINCYEALDIIMEEEWNQMQDLQEGIRDWLASKWRNAKEAIAGMFTVVKNLYKKYIQAVVARLLQMLSDAASKGIESLFNFLGVDISANVSFGNMK